MDIANALQQYIRTEIMLDEFNFEIPLHYDLIRNGILDSIGMEKLLLFLENDCQIIIPSEDLTKEQFRTMNHIIRFVSAL